MKMHICHLSTVHGRYDTRIFKKQCRSLSEAGYNVSFIVTDGGSNEQVDGMNIIGLKKAKNRIFRIFWSTWQVYKQACKVNAELYIFHDPELLPFGLFLKFKKYKVIYDAHEDVPRDILFKPYLPKILRFMVSHLIEFFEDRVSRRLDMIFTATPFIRDRFLNNHANAIDINNYPIIGDLKPGGEWSQKEDAICYIGDITKNRGIKQLVESVSDMNVRLDLAGLFYPEDFEKELKENPGWKNVVYHGFISRDEANKILKKAKAGVVLFLPEPNHINAQPNKMFEFMSASIPILVSDFDLWREIVEKNECGICVDPLDPHEISKQIECLVTNNEKSAQMGHNGRTAVESKYNWAIEKKKYLAEIKKILRD